MPAALLMARLASEARYCFLSERRPAAAVARLNQQLYPLTSPTDRFISLAVAVLDPAAHTLTLVNAGHPAPLHYRKGQRAFAPTVDAEQTGPLLGVSETCQCAEYSLTLAPGDCLLFFSDGVTDAQNAQGRSFRMKGIESVLDTGPALAPRTLGERLVKAVQEHSLGRAQYDDITLISFGRTSGKAS
jgi:serine phosphatase RsbU (regulator of sigma subunit)